MTKTTIIDIYAAAFPFDTDGVAVPVERAEEIAGCLNSSVRQSKFYVWKLLEYGLKNSLGLDIAGLEINKAGSKWVSPYCEFSLSHSGRVAAVAISQKPVGVDIEERNPARFVKLKDKIATEKEMEIADGERLNILWTVKEAAFKCGSKEVFVPNKIDTDGVTSVTKTVQAGDKQYYLTVVSQDAQHARFIPLNVIIK